MLQLVNYIITELVSSLQLHYTYIIIELASSVVWLSISFINHIALIIAFPLCFSDRGEKKVLLNLLYVNQCWECAFDPHHTNSKRLIL